MCSFALDFILLSGFFSFLFPQEHHVIIARLPIKEQFTFGDGEENCESIDFIRRYLLADASLLNFYNPFFVNIAAADPEIHDIYESRNKSYSHID